MPGQFDEYIHIGNVRSYQRQLLAALDPERRRMLLTLLAEETAAAKKAGWTPLYK